MLQSNKYEKNAHELRLREKYNSISIDFRLLEKYNSSTKWNDADTKVWNSGRKLVRDEIVQKNVVLEVENYEAVQHTTNRQFGHPNTASRQNSEYLAVMCSVWQKHISSKPVFPISDSTSWVSMPPVARTLFSPFFRIATEVISDKCACGCKMRRA